MLDELNRVVDAAEHSALSDRLGVSTALYLGATDMLKLRAMLEQPDWDTVDCFLPEVSITNQVGELIELVVQRAWQPQSVWQPCAREIAILCFEDLAGCIIEHNSWVHTD